jgi:hypothetical protein
MTMSLRLTSTQAGPGAPGHGPSPSESLPGTPAVELEGKPASAILGRLSRLAVVVAAMMQA